MQLHLSAVLLCNVNLFERLVIIMRYKYKVRLDTLENNNCIQHQKYDTTACSSFYLLVDMFSELSNN
jgi:hypothetical protein